MSGRIRYRCRSFSERFGRTILPVVISISFGCAPIHEKIASSLPKEDVSSVQDRNRRKQKQADVGLELNAGLTIATGTVLLDSLCAKKFGILKGLQNGANQRAATESLQNSTEALIYSIKVLARLNSIRAGYTVSQKLAAVLGTLQANYSKIPEINKTNPTVVERYLQAISDLGFSAIGKVLIDGIKNLNIDELYQKMFDCVCRR
ncbi:hypothetical protein HY988_03320 [Candidatus Micrarchaeota archaeon]|nr:hypothetical protein [Candidatus Micrarchaeota archaeon]